MVDTPQLPFPGLPLSASKWLSDPNLSYIDAFSDFIGVARGIADRVELPAEERIERLGLLESQIDGAASETEKHEAAARLSRTLADSGVAADHARHVIQACQKDVATEHYRSWSEFLTYCQFAAAPGGKFVFELHGESGPALKSAEGLYSAWRTMAAILSCKRDYTELGRIYLPASWMRDGGVDGEALRERRTDPRLREVFNRMLDGVDRLVATARSQSADITHHDLRRATRQSLAVADRFARKIRRRDPLTGRISLSRWDVFAGRVKGRR